MYFQVAGCMTDIERLIRIEASGGAVVFGASSQTHNAPAKDLSMKEVKFSRLSFPVRSPKLVSSLLENSDFLLRN